MEKAKKTKLFIGLSYLILITIFLFLFFSKFSLQEITSYDFIKENRTYFLELKNSNLIFSIPNFFNFYNIMGISIFRLWISDCSSRWFYFWKMDWNLGCCF